MAWNNEKESEVKAELIVEVLGKPPEHLIETLKKIIERIGEEKGVKILKNKISEPQALKDNPEFYTTFAEIEVEVEEILYLVMLMFKYMPAHIEIIYPEKIVSTNNGWNEILNEIARRLHGYDEIARVLQIEKGVLEKRLRELLPKKIEGKKEKKTDSSVKSENKNKKE